MITENKKLRLAFFIFSLLCVTAVGICLICDFAINRSLTWSYYVLSSLIYSWVIVTPLIMAKKDRLIITVSAFAVATFPYLYILDKITPVHGWFTALALPITATAVIAVYITYILFRFMKINKWYISSIIAFMYGIIVNSVTQYYVSVYTGDGFINLNYFINLAACLVIVALLAIIGYSGGIKRKQVNTEHEENKNF